MKPPDQAPYAHGVEDDLPKPKWITDAYRHYPPPVQVSDTQPSLMNCGICHSPTTITEFKTREQRWTQFTCATCHATLRYYRPRKSRSKPSHQPTKGTNL